MNLNPYTKNLKTCVFDIETMGFMPHRDIMISASFCESDGTVVQYFTESPEKESEMIQKTVDKLRSYDAIITYNGDSFDIGFVQIRAKKYGIDFDTKSFWSIDLYKWLKKYWPAAKTMPSLKQKAVEEYMGLSKERTDEIGGGECISLYNLWLFNGDASAKAKILLHNADDVRQLKKISDRSTFLPFNKIAFENGFGNKKYLIKSIELGKQLVITAETRCINLPVSIFESDYSAEYTPDTGKLLIKINYRNVEDILFADLTKLPLSSCDFSLYEGYRSGYLLFSEQLSSKIYYREMTTVAEYLIKAFLDT